MMRGRLRRWLVEADADKLDKAADVLQAAAVLLLCLALLTAMVGVVLWGLLEGGR